MYMPENNKEFNIVNFKYNLYNNLILYEVKVIKVIAVIITYSNSNIAFM